MNRRKPWRRVLKPWVATRLPERRRLEDPVRPLRRPVQPVEDIKQKILDPKSWMAEGFEKEYEKGKMPDKYKDLMEDQDVVALATWLVTFKNTSVNTPKPIKKK